MPNDPRQRTNTSTSSTSVDSLRLQTSLSSSTSSGSAKSPLVNPATVSQAPLNLHAALDAANGNPKAALESVITERNMLSSQNAQLWKLIEKQRSGYANVLRELDRVRAERDQARYKGANGPTSSAYQSENESAPSATTPRRKSAPRQPSEDSVAVGTKDELRVDTKGATPSPEPSSSRVTPSPSAGTPQKRESNTIKSEAGRDVNHLHSLGESIPTTEPLNINKERAPSSTIEVHPPKSVAPETIAFTTPPNPSPMNLAPPVVLAAGGRDKTIRESTISLPAEAKQYITNMTDSPVRSPVLQRSRSSSPEKTRPSPLVESSPNASSSTAFPRISEDITESKSPSQPPTPRATETPPRRPIDLKLKINGSITSGPSTTTLINSSQASTPGEEPLEQETPYSVTSAHPFGRSGMTQASSGKKLTEIELSAISIRVKTSTIRPNDRGKEVISFIIEVEPPNKSSWRIEKLYSGILNLDSSIRSMTSRQHIKKLASLPETKLFKDNAPAKVDQRKMQLEMYLKSVVTVPVKKTSEICEFFCADVIDESRAPVAQLGYKEGYLTKRGKNFGGWKTRYFVLQGPVLEYYENRGGAHLGSISITNSQIGRQQRSQTGESGDDNEYRHAFLIIEAKRGASGQNRHVLCAESDSERDSWVDVLVRYVSGTFDDTALTSTSAPTSSPAPTRVTSPPSRNSADSFGTTTVQPTRKLGKALSKDDIARGPAVPLAKLPSEMQHGKLFAEGSQNPSSAVDRHPPMELPRRQDSQQSHLTPNMHEPEHLSASLPSTSPLDTPVVGPSARSNSELGHYPDLSDSHTSHLNQSTPSRADRGRRQSYAPSLGTVQASPTVKSERPTTPDLPATNQSNYPHISGPTNGIVLPSGFKFGVKDSSSDHPVSDRDRKTKSTAFWRFGRSGEKQTTLEAPRAVFGVTLTDTLSVVQIANLPAVVFRCIQYLEAKKADEEEGIYRLSGSSAVIKSLKDRFNAEGDVDLLASDEIWDPHAIAGLLKQFFRELPASVLTREWHLRFLAVMDLASQEDRIAEMASLVSQLPFENYSLLRALSAHLIRVVQNAAVNKMTVRNLGIVFSPTLGVPAGVFTLMLNDFKRVFSVDDTVNDTGEQPAAGSSRRNSRNYEEGAADRLLGLSGRSLAARNEGQSSDTEDDISIHGESESGTDDVLEGDSNTGLSEENSVLRTPRRRSGSNDEAALRTPRGGRAANVAAERGLHISTDKQTRRQSRHIVGLPRSPRPPQQQPSTPRSGQISGSFPNTPR